MNEQRRFDEDDVTVGPAPWTGSAPPAAAARAEAAAAPSAAPATPSALSQPAPSAQPRRRSLAARLLTALVLLMAGAAAAIYAGPKLVPMLPAPVAAWLTPAGAGAAAATLRALLDAETATLRRELAAAAAASLDQLQALEARIGAAASGGSDPAADARLDRLETALAALAETQRQAERRDDEADASSLASVRADLAALDRKIDSAPAFTAPADLDDLRRRLAALEAAVAADVAVRERALAEAGDARRAAAVTAVLSDIDRAMALGQPFPDALAALRETTGIAPPAVLAEAAVRGAPTREAIQAGFSAVAHRAVTEALAADTDGQHGVGEVLARVQARFTGIPSDPIEGDSAPAVLSRVRHDLLNGRIDAALAGIATLPAPAQAAMADWVEGARLRYGADAALTQLRARAGRTN
jgi:hypothetical protein